MRGIVGLRAVAVALSAMALSSFGLAWAGDNATATGSRLAAPPLRDEAAHVEGEPLYAIPTTPDAIGRVMAPVYVNGRGPFRFIVDTGANRSVLSPRLARELGVDATGRAQQLVHGVTGAEPAPLVQINNLQFGALTRSNVAMPVVSNRIHANADGMLGADHMHGARLTIDFRHDRIDLSPSAGARLRNFYVMPAQMHFGQLPMVTARLGRVAVKAVIDTGAERSIANSALRRMLEAGDTHLTDAGTTVVYGAVGPDAMATVAWAPNLLLAGIRIDRLPILFSDTHFFELWDLEKEPALLIGMDVLGQLDTLVVDYRRSEVGFKIMSTGEPVARVNARASRL